MTKKKGFVALLSIACLLGTSCRKVDATSKTERPTVANTLDEKSEQWSELGSVCSFVNPQSDKPEPDDFSACQLDIAGLPMETGAAPSMALTVPSSLKNLGVVFWSNGGGLINKIKAVFKGTNGYKSTVLIDGVKSGTAPKELAKAVNFRLSRDIYNFIQSGNPRAAADLLKKDTIYTLTLVGGQSLINVKFKAPESIRPTMPLQFEMDFKDKKNLTTILKHFFPKGTPKLLDDGTYVVGETRINFTNVNGWIQMKTNFDNSMMIAKYLEKTTEETEKILATLEKHPNYLKILRGLSEGGIR